MMTLPDIKEKAKKQIEKLNVWFCHREYIVILLLDLLLVRYIIRWLV